MATSNIGTINVNTASKEDLKLIPNVGDKTALAILKLRDEKRSLDIEDLKSISTIPNTVWDPLVDRGVMTFEEGLGVPSLKDTIAQIQELQKVVANKDVQISIKQKEIQSYQQELQVQEQTLKQQFKEQINNRQHKFQSELDDTKTNYETLIKQEEESKKDEIEKMKQKLFDQDQKYTGKMAQMEQKIQQLEEDKLSKQVDKLAPQGIYTARKPQPNKTSDNETSKKHTNSKSNSDSESSDIHGPSPPKMAIFDGKDDWRPFFTQFSHIARRYKWTDEQKLYKLIECLRDKALKYFSSRLASDQTNFKQISAELDERFGKKDLPHIIRRQLQDIKQGPDETIEEFADKIQEMTTDGYPDTPDDCRQTVSIDAFLLGCLNKQAALTAMDKNPPSLDTAVQNMKSALTNQRFILGVKKG
ncbi:hypothetical protein FSP39_025070 [Pinctada imbricata]|uniref:Retrotransposon gag domain-containing protein n=1 Tax=Pinctada imbricata TaxID=66713 RepID=A0AA89BLF5_PINIB|nr:hypothetical protein FSP39_025070 [Pinctada imbricata]